jgi:hypothetical protein
VSLSRDLYRAARLQRDLEVLASGDPNRIARRIRNRMISRILGRAGVWRFLYGGGRR